MRSVDKLDKIGPAKVKAILLDDCGLTDEQAEEILKFIAIRGSNAQVVAALEGISVETLTPIEAMNELYKLKKMLN